MIDPIFVGDLFKDKHGNVKVLAIADNYIMARRPRCHPFVKSRKEFLKSFSKQ